MFTRDHLMIGAGAFVLGAVVATGSIMAVLSLHGSPPPVAAAVTPPPRPAPAVSTPPPVAPAIAPVIVAPKPAAPPAAPVAPVAVIPPTKHALAPHPAEHKAEHPEARPVARATPPKAKASAPAPVAKAGGLEGEEADRQKLNTEQLEKKKKNLQAQVADSDEIIKLKEQQIKALEARLNAH